MPTQRLRRSSGAGITLVELLVALAISGIILPLIWTTIQGAIRLFEANIWQVQLERDLNRLATLLNHEAEDACLFSTTAAPGDCAAPTPVCAAAANQLRMRVTLLNANNVPAGTAVITYTRDNNNELRRTGPTILANGRLDPTNTAANNQLVMRGVTAFTVTPNDDCNTATIQATAQPVASSTFAAPGFGPPVSRTIGLRSGSRPFVD